MTDRVHPVRAGRRPRPALLAGYAAAVVGACVFGVGGVFPVGEASAHGTASDPPARAYQCHVTSNNDLNSPGLTQRDPMCAMLLKESPDAVYNWNGIYQNGVAGKHETAVPDGTLCSGGNAEGGKFKLLDTPGKWVAAKKPAKFTLSLLDTAVHGYDYMRIYVTKQGFDPATQKLTWADLVLSGGSETKTPASAYPGQTPEGPVATFDVDAGAGRSGPAVVFVVWQASHMDQTFYLCSDVTFDATATP